MKIRSLFSLRPALVEQTAGLAPASVTGMRDLLRDTALLVSNLKASGQSETFDSLRAHCKELVKNFGEALKRRGYSEDLCEDALTAQCALLDETALSELPAGDRDRWSLQPLQVETFKHHDAGERVFDRLDFRMRERSPVVDVLECYAAILSLGFAGRYAIDRTGRREALITELNALIMRLRPPEERTFVIDEGRSPFSGWFRRLSPWGIALIGCVIALTVWLGWHVALDSQLAALTSHTVKP